MVPDQSAEESGLSHETTSRREQATVLGPNARTSDSATPAEMEKAHDLQAGQTRVLRLLASGAALKDVLNELIFTMEQAAPGMLGSVLLYDDATRTLRHCTAPNLPEDYNAAVNGLRVGPAVGSCGTAVHLCERVIVDDIMTDPKWEAFRDIARRSDLAACWSQPILSSVGAVLGTFALYYRKPREPVSEELELIEQAANLAAIAIERKQSERALAESAERFRQLAEKVRVIPWEASATTWQFTYVGPQAEELLGYSKEQWCEPGFWAAHIHSDDRDRVTAKFSLAVATEDHFDSEYRMLSADDHTVWLHDVVNVVRYDDGSRGLRGFLIDVTARKQAEEAARQVERLAAIGTLAAGIAHEINNPIAAILLGAQNALNGTRGAALPSGVREILEGIVFDSERCGTIVSSVLKFSRRAPGKRLPSDANRLVQSAVDLTRRYAEESRAKVYLHLDRNLPLIDVNPLEIEQVLVNVLRNAVESGDGVVEVHAQTGQGVDTVEIVVSDNGRGMTNDELSQLFDPFFTTRQREGGTGLGLSIAHGIVVSHGGTISVTGQPMGGTRVTIKLPIPQ